MINEDFFRARIRQAIKRRASLRTRTNAMRLIHAESDQLPGVIADQYGDVVVLQILTAGMEPQRDLLARLLIEEAGAKTIYERSDADVRVLEGLTARNGLITGAALKDEVTTPAGCTIDGLMALEEGKLRVTLIKAVLAAAKRSKSLRKAAST